MEAQEDSLGILLLLPEDWAAQNLGLRGREATAVVHSASSSPSERANALHPRSPPFFRLKKPFELERTRLDRRKWVSIA